jgi:NADH-quinone oxidoreductase subunit H
MHEFSLWQSILTVLIIFGVLQGICALLIYLERKVSAWVQDRIGPNRVGPAGLLQPVADGLKFLFKEDIIPGHVKKFLFLLAPCVALTTAMLAFSVVPFGPVEVPAPVRPVEPLQPQAPAVKSDAKAWERYKRDTDGFKENYRQYEKALAVYQKKQAVYEQVVQDYPHRYQFIIAPNVDIGILFVFAVSSLAVYGIILGGWSANNKYSMLGALRSSAQIISYEIPLGLSILGVVMLTGSLNLEQIIWNQAAYSSTGGTPIWYVVYQPLAFLIFMISAFAETNRLPFDLPEAEQELIGGYHTEYSAMKFAMFFLGEYTHMITTSFLMVVLFFGGWHFPWIAEAGAPWIVQLIVFLVKMSLFILWYMLIRWTLPRFRYDQLMALAWKVMIPLALINLVGVMVVLEIRARTGADWLPWLLLPFSLLVLLGMGFFVAKPPPTRAQLNLRLQARQEQPV